MKFDLKDNNKKNLRMIPTPVNFSCTISKYLYKNIIPHNFYHFHINVS